MRKLQTNKKRLAPLIVCSLLVLQQTAAVAASNITDGEGAPIAKDPYSGHFEISPDAFHGDVGFKKFQDLKLDKGDIMNFIFEAYNLNGNIVNEDGTITGSSETHWDTINTFVNLVQNGITINGIVNTLDSISGNFKPGNLVFVSPQGMVVGASGVLNVGSLSVFTPTQPTFDNLFKSIPVADRIKLDDAHPDLSYGTPGATEISQTWDPSSMAGGTAPITINGMVVARGDVTLDGSAVTVGKEAGATDGYGGILMAGVGENTDTTTVLTGQSAADTLFNKLVNADNMNTGNGFANANGKIVIKSTQGTTIDEGSIVRNYASNSQTSITNTGSDGVNINGELSNTQGTLTVDNQAGALNVGSDGLVRNNGTMDLNNHVSGTGVSIAGTVENDGTMNITNESGNNGLSISGSVTNDTGAATIYNHLGGLNVSGSVTSNGTSLAMTNDGDDGFTIASGGSVTSTNGDADLINNENMFDINGTVTSSGDTLDITNNGANGLNIAGRVNNNAGAGKITNNAGSTNGGLNISGTVYNNGSSIGIDNHGADGLNISGLVDSDSGNATINNYEAGLNVQTGGRVENDGTSLAMHNEGDGGFTIDGSVTNNAGTADLENTNNMFDINGTVSNAGTSLDITNSGNNGLSIDGTVHNSNGSATMTNEAGEFLVSGSGKVIGDVSSQKITMTNTGSGFTMAGSVDNINELEMSNAGSNGFDISGTVTNDGNADISNTAGLLNISGTVTNSGNIDIYNHNTGIGFDISGTVSNSEGIANLTNDAGAFDILEGGEVNSNGTQLNITNNGVDGLNIAGDVNNNAGAGQITNNAGSTNGGLNISGTVYNNGSSIGIDNHGADGLNISGLVDSDSGNATINNYEAGLHVQTGGRVENDGDLLAMTNDGADGFTIDGSVTSRNGDTDLINNENMFDINGTVTSSGDTLDITNNGVNGLNIAGRVNNNAGAGKITNNAGSTNGGLNISGTVYNNGSSIGIDNYGADGLNISGLVDSDRGNATINNYEAGLHVQTGGRVENDGDLLAMNNSGDAGFTVDGLIDNNKGDATLSNTAGNFNINEGGKVDNGEFGGILSITNSGSGELNINAGGTVLNDGDELNMTNNGAGGFSIGGLIDNNKGNATLSNTAGNFNINEGGKVDNGEFGGILSITNSSGELNINAGGTVLNDGDELNMTNNGAGGFSIGGLIDNNSGDATIHNDAGTMNIKDTGRVENDGTSLTMSNKGEGGFIVDGLIDNNKGDATLMNTDGNFDINNEINNSGDALSIQNNGMGTLNVPGKVINTGSSLEMTNEGNGGFIVNGLVDNDNGDADLTNSAGDFDIAGEVNNSGADLTMSNSGNGAFNVQTGGQVVNDGDSLAMTNDGDGGFTIDGSVTNNNGHASIENTNNMLDITGTVNGKGSSLDINNSGANGLNVKGTGSVNNTSGYLHMTNTQGGLNVAPDANINSSGSEIVMNNSGAGGMNIQGHVTNTNNTAKVEFRNSNSNMVIGHETTDNNIQSNADILMAIQNGNLLNYFADKGINPTDAGYRDATKTLITTTEGADLTINAQNGQIGTDLGLCDGGVCTGIGPNERNLTKSINTSIDGTITADSTGENALVNMASLDTDMRVNKIHAENGKVILLADDKYNKGATRYDIVNRAEDDTVPNLKGDAISAIASGNIGEDADNKLTFIQTNANVDIANENDDASLPHDLYDEPIAESKGGVEFLAQGDINIKGLDNADGTKNDTKVCTIASREGSVNAEFSGDTYIRDITAQNEVNIVNRGPEIYIENLGGAPSRYAETGDYYGMYDGIVPEKANIKALDLGTPDDPHTFERDHYPNSTIVIKNGTINGKGSTSHPGLDQDITVTADNSYVGGYYFNMGKHRYDDPENPNGLSQVTPDDHTNPLVNAGDPDTPVSIRGKAVRPDDVEDIGQDTGLRDYYYWDQDGDGHPENNDPDPDGSGQKDDPTYDPDKETGDDLVVPEPDDPTPPGDDDDDDGPDPTPGDDDDDDGPDPTPGDDDDDGPDPTPGDDDDDGPDPTPGDDDDDGPDPTPGDDDDDGPDEPPADMDDAKRTWKKEIDDNISVIDKRQYIRFDIEGNPNPVIFESVPEVSGILNISRGGVQLSHNKTLKVGDIVPVHLKYGDVEINANVKIVSANDRTAGGEFVDLDLATANQLLYLSLLMDGSGNIQQEQYAQTENGTLSTTGDEE